MRSRPNVAFLSAFFALLLSGGLCRVPAAEDGSDGAAARQQWMLGYLKVEQAASARRDQHLALARQLYAEALTLFQDVERRYPEWNPTLVSYRTADCADQLRRLDEAVNAALGTMSRAELTAEVRRLREARQGLDAQAQSLAMKVEQMEASLQAAVSERLKLSADVARLTAESTQSRQRAADLQARLDVVSTGLKAREADDVAQLRQTHAAALAQISALQAASEQDRTALAAARDTEQRLTAAIETSRRAGAETAQVENRRRAELQQLEAAAAKALEGGDAATAEAALRRLLDANPQDAVAAARLGGLLADRGDVQSAETLLQRARRSLPEDTDLLLRLGAVLLRQGRTMPAAAALLQAAAAAPERPAVHHLLGAALVEIGWRDAAEREFSRALELDGKRADTAYCLAALLATAQPPRRQEARIWYDRALALGAARDAGLDGFFTDDR